MKKIFKNYFRPFWFSSKCEQIKPPYVYGFILQVTLFYSVFKFIELTILKYDAALLAVFAGVIGTLAGLYVGVLHLYDRGRK